ncbi:unnamed protein product [Arabidopsis arenosa]|uniref:Cupin type-2 domain-containing protein n=1 Tax=Arabidopsis arenosa TaxID=38785 RepID=A0A8S2AW51_ARAAE|nr:unnamed protein product [Arabidopsis arenosa]
MYLAKMKEMSSSGLPPQAIERLVFVVEGAVTLTNTSSSSKTLTVDSYAYLPPNFHHSLNCVESATLVVFERRYEHLGSHTTELIVGSTDKQPLLETPGEVFELRKLLPVSLAYDFNIHIMDFQPGEFLNVKEVHYNQHGLLLLEGQGIYRLGDNWYPVQAGDVIWMAPFVPQWYAALGKTRIQNKNKQTAEARAWISLVIAERGVNRVSVMAAQNVNIYERLNEAAQVGDIERLYKLIEEDPKILGHFDELPFCETPLHIAAERGQTHFAMELMTLKPSLALKLNPSGFSPMHLALENNHFQTVRGFVAIDSNLVSIKGRGRITPLHYVAQIGHAELLTEFLFACPSSVEDLTIKCETAVHIAVKNHQLLAFKVLWGWVQREHKEEILDWKDEDGNTVFHIAASINQTEVMKLLRRTVKVKAKNLAGKTAMDILQTHQSPRFPKENSPDSTQDNDYNVHAAGQMTMSFNHALLFFIVNGVAFFSSLFVIMILIIGLPMWMVLYGSTAALGIANYASFSDTFPNPNSPFREVAASLLPIAYPVITGFILFPPIVAFFVNRRRRNQVDFPAMYFTPSQGLS